MGLFSRPRTTEDEASNRFFEFTPRSLKRCLMEHVTIIMNGFLVDFGSKGEP
jgi:hypothetical protein